MKIRTEGVELFHAGGKKDGQCEAILQFCKIA